MRVPEATAVPPRPAGTADPKAAPGIGRAAAHPGGCAGHTMQAMAALRVAVVPHTHWDREWYRSYQEFRLNLVDVLDRLLVLLESDDSYPYFMLDGQMAVVDDYLEVRPEGEERLRALAAAGRISMGPWYILMDEFLASGETIIRNLQMGLRRGAAFGGTMEVGYLPDMFGHIAQMPQILTLAGLGDAVVWRGVPSAITRTGFDWEAPDGSVVRAEYLPDGYSNGAVLPDDAEALVDRTADLLATNQDLVLGDLLCMNGSDHLVPQPELGRVVAEANAIQEEFHFAVTSLPEYLAAAPKEGLERWTGELRSGSRANMLMGVTSNRVDVKRLGEETTRQLERRAEPLAALFQPPSEWPQHQLDLAWKEVVRNSAHDSICACSIDDVVDAVLHRYAEARTIATGLARRAVRSLARSMAQPGTYVLNPAARPRAGVVELVVEADAPPAPGVQVLSEDAAPPEPRGTRRRDRPYRPRAAPGPADRARLLDSGHLGRGQRRRLHRPVLGRARGTAQRPHRPGQTDHPGPDGGPAGRHHPPGPRPARPPSYRGPGRRGPRLRMATVRTELAGPSRRCQRTRRGGVPVQRSGDR